MEWKELLSHSYSSGDQLADLLHLDPEEAALINQISEQYPMFINPYYASLIDPDDPEDPIRKMSVPSAWELESGGEADTSGEAHNTILPGMQHKYRQTVLILTTEVCSMYCRHCFRKRMVGLGDDETAKYLPAMGEYVRSHPEVNNVLLTGGDSFLLSNERIRRLLEIFAPIPGLDFIRFGTRTPVVLPQRITGDPELLDILSEYSKQKQIFVITQFNHPREVTPEAAAAIHALEEIHIPVRNQTVLLKGINDDPKVLAALLSSLTAAGIVPYYIFQCRPVRGVQNHFQIPLRQAVRIVDEAKNLQNGQGKCVRFCMSHPRGKIEILGEMPDKSMLFKYHQAKYPEDAARIFTYDLGNEDTWLPVNF